jgi:hypothetical protein
MEKVARSIGRMAGAPPSDTFLALPRCPDSKAYYERSRHILADLEEVDRIARALPKAARLSRRRCLNRHT